MTDMKEFIQNMPKAELHLHIEGCVEPEMLLRLAKRNGVELPFANEEEVWAAQDYGQPALDNFLRYHGNCIRVLQKEEDFYELTYEFMRKCGEENILYVEIMFETHAHLDRGIPFEVFFEGMNRGRLDGERDFGVKSNWIMNFQRDFSGESCMAILDSAQAYRDQILAVGLDNYEEHDFPKKFIDVFTRAREEGYKLTSHCDCDQPNSINHIKQCLDLLKVDRLDHGLHVLDDAELQQRVIDEQIHLTMCPTWRPSDGGPRRVENVRKMLELGISVSLNTDDPSEFASRYLSHMLLGVQQAGDFSREEMGQFVANAFKGSWLSEAEKEEYLQQLDNYIQEAAAS